MKLTVDNYKPLYEADPAHWAEMSTDAKFDYLTDEIKKESGRARMKLRSVEEKMLKEDAV